MHGNVTSRPKKQNNSVLCSTNEESGAVDSDKKCSDEKVENCSCYDSVGTDGAVNESDIKGKTVISSVPDTSVYSYSVTMSNNEMTKTGNVDIKDVRESGDGCYSNDYSERKSGEQSKNEQAIESQKSNALHPKNILYSENKCLWKCDQAKLKLSWIRWSEHVANSLRSILLDLHKSEWTCTILHVEHVKSYAPHIDHMVADIHFVPKIIMNN